MRFALVFLCSFALFAQLPEVPGTPVELAALRYIDIQPGTGAPAAAGKKLTVHYTGYLTSGKKFDSSLDRQEPFSFTQGKRQVIAGFDNGFEGMKVGGKRRLLIASQLAYGAKGTGLIPPNSPLVFDVELLDVQDSPDLPAANDVLQAFQNSRQELLALIQAVPADKWDWRPGPGVRSFGEVFLHIAVGNDYYYAIASKNLTADDLKALDAASDKEEKAGGTREQIVKKFTASFEPLLKMINTARPGQLAQEKVLYGSPNTVHGVLIQDAAHNAEHLGQLIAYLRVNGIKPPWSN